MYITWHFVIPNMHVVYTLALLDALGPCPQELAPTRRLPNRGAPPPSCGCSRLVWIGSDRGGAEDTGGCHVQTEGTSGTEEGTH